MVYCVALQPSSLRRAKKVRLIPQVLRALYLKLFAKPFKMQDIIRGDYGVKSVNHSRTAGKN